VYHPVKLSEDVGDFGGHRDLDIASQIMSIEYNRERPAVDTLSGGLFDLPNALVRYSSSQILSTLM
jgi:hypothetical protein